MELKYLTDIEAARLLRMPVAALSRSEIHRCEDGYHIDTLKEFCAKNGIPLLNRGFILGLSNEDSPEDDRVLWKEDLFDLLWSANQYCKAIITPTEVPGLWDFIKRQGSTRLILIGESPSCHISANSWSKAIDIACQNL